MSILKKCIGWSLGFATIALPACGGSSVESAPSEATPAPAPAPAPPPTTLSISASALALAAANAAARPAPIPGAPRVLTVINTGTAPAVGVVVDPSGILPVGTSITSNCAGALAPLASCTFTITPGAVATAAPVTLSIQGSNTNTVASAVQVLAYGSVYQGGLVFAIDDATPNTGSVGGKVVEANASMDDVIWSPFPANAIPGIDQRSSTPCVGARDGACNTQVIVAFHVANLPGLGPTTYAAGVCSESTFAGYLDWYLPAICETGVDVSGRALSGCGSRTAPTLQNIYSSLVDNVNVKASFDNQWTSTAISNFSSPYSQQYKHPTYGSYQNVLQYGSMRAARCVRAITP